jgi:hypothetical protein
LYRHHLAEIDTDGLQETALDVVIFDPGNEVEVINGLKLDNGIRIEWNAISRGSVPDSLLYASFKKSAHSKKLAMRLKLSNEEKQTWKFDVNTWTDDYLKCKSSLV